MGKNGRGRRGAAPPPRPPLPLVGDFEPDLLIG